MFVVRSQYGGWSTPCKNRLMNNEEIVVWLDLAFAKGQEPSKDKIYINVSDFFMTCYLNRKGETKPKMYIKSWQEDLNVPQRSNGNVEVQNNNDPFANKTIKPNSQPSSMKQVQQTLSGDGKGVTGNTEIRLDCNDLDFY